MNDNQLKLSDTLAIERTLMAAERTLMGWVRTALSLISFGFTIYKFLETIAQKEGATKLLQQNSPRTVGLTLIAIGIFALVIACLQHKKFTRTLALGHGYKLVDLSFVVATLIGLLGVVMFVSMVLRMGPLG